MEVKNRELIRGTSDWTSPSLIEEVVSDYNTHHWLNLDNMMNWEDKTYAIVENGVRKSVPSQTFKCSGFIFDIPNNVEITNVEVRLLVIDDTNGGTNIKDNSIKLCGKTIKCYSTFWNEQNSEIRTYSLNISDIDDVTFEYSCIGTGSDYQIPLIYGVQCRLIYYYYEDIITDDLPQYQVTASLSDYELQGNNNTSTLTLNRYCSNGKSGMFGNVYINLSDNLKFNDGSNRKVINAVNTNHLWSSTDEFLIRGKQTGLGKVTITSSSMTNPITLYILINNDMYYNDHFTVLESNTFDSCHADERGGAIYNNSYLNNSGSSYNANIAEVEGENIYEATTEIHLNVENEYEAGKVTFSLEVKTANNEKIVDKGKIYLYDESNEIGNTDVDNNGIAILSNIKLDTIGNHNLKFVYKNPTLEFGNTSIRKSVKITKKNTVLCILDDKGNPYDLNNTVPEIQQNTYMYVCLIEQTSNLPIADETIIWDGKKYVTNEKGIAYVMVMESIGKHKIKLSYNGNGNCRETSLLTTINVTLKNVNIITEDLYARKGVQDSYTVKLIDNEGNPLASKKVYIYMENTIDSKGIKDYELKTSTSGTATVPIEFDKGIWVTTNTFKSDGVYKTVKTYTNIISYDVGYNETKIELNNTTVKGVVSDTVTISGRLIDVLGQSGLKRDLQIIAIDKTNNVKVYKQLKSDIEGYFSIDLSLSKGEYVFQVIFLGDITYDGCINSGNISIVKTGNEPCIIESANYKGEIKKISDFKAILTNEDGVTLTNRKILFNFKKSNKEWYDYTVYTNEYGIAEAPSIGLNTGVYLVKTTFLGDENYKGTSNKNILIVTNSSSIFDSEINLQSETEVNNKRRVTFVLTGTNTNHPPITLSRQYVSIATYNENGYIDTTELITNDYGGFYIDLDNTPQLTIVQAIYTGSSIYKDYEYTHVYYRPLTTGVITSLKSSNVSLFEGENKYYIATLKDNDNSPIKNKKICTEIIHSDMNRDIIYTTTNELGEIEIELSKYSPDVYTVKSYFAGDSKYRSCVCSSNIKIDQNANKIPTVIVGEDYRKTYIEMLADDIFDVELTAGVLGNLKTPTTNEDIVRSNKLADKKIVFYIQNLDKNFAWTQTSKTNDNGIAQLPLTNWVGNFRITYTFLGDKDYAQSQGTSEIQIKPANEYESLIEAYDQECKYGEDININIRLMNELPSDIDITDEGKPIANSIINVKFINRITQNELLVKKQTSELGRAKISLLGNDLTDSNEIEKRKKFFTVGIYDVIIYFEGDNNYKPCEKDVELVINPTGKMEKVYIKPKNIGYETISNIKMSVGDSSLILADFIANTNTGRPVIYDENGDIVDTIEEDYVLFNFYDRANQKISYMVQIQEEEHNGVKHSVAKFDCGILAGGVYDCYIEYPTQTNFVQNGEVRIQVEVVPKKPLLVCLASDDYDDIVTERTFNYTNEGYLKVGLYYDDGLTGIRWLNNEYIFFVINGVTYHAITGRNDDSYPELDDNGNSMIKDGIAKLSIKNISNLPVGSYPVSVYNLSSNNIESSTMSFILTITSEEAWISGLDDSTKITYGEYQGNYKEGNTYDVNIYFQKNEVHRGDIVGVVGIGDIKIQLSYSYRKRDGTLEKFTLPIKTTDVNGNVKFNIPIPKPMDILKEIDNYGYDDYYFIINLSVEAITDNYKTSDGKPITDEGIVKIIRNKIMFHNYEYVKPTSIKIEVNERMANSSNPNPDSQIKEGTVYIDIDKVG